MKTWKEAQSRKLPPELDKRRVLSEEHKEKISSLYKTGTFSQRQLAQEYGVSRRLIQFIIDPEKLKRQKELFRERRKDGRYYDREKHTKAIRELRRKKAKLYKEGKLEQNKNISGEV